jgi:hypothetical protein
MSAFFHVWLSIALFGCTLRGDFRASQLRYQLQGLYGYRL